MRKWEQHPVGREHDKIEDLRDGAQTQQWGQHNHGWQHDDWRQRPNGWANAPWQQNRGGKVRAVRMKIMLFVVIFLLIHGGGFLIGGLAALSVAVAGSDELIIGIVFTLIGGIELIICLALACRMITKKRRNRRLLESGERIDAPITDVRRSNIRINNRCTFVIICEWDDRYEGRVTCKSKIFWDDPAPILIEMGASTMPVCYDEMKPRRCVMDTSAIEL